MTAPTVRKDPLESVWVCSLFFGGILLLVSLVGVVRALAVGTEVQGADVWRAWAFLAIVGGVTGPAVAFVRRATRKRTRRTKNVATGMVAGAVYALGCALVASEGMTTAEKLGLNAIVFLGFAWAIASGLDKALPQSPARRKKRTPAA
jgi:hypothetical protein